MKPDAVSTPNAQGNLGNLSALASGLRQQQLDGFNLGPAAASVARWCPQTEQVHMYEALNKFQGIKPEARSTVRWLTAMHGPEQAVFATYRASARDQHQAYTLPRSSHTHPFMGAALQQLLPRTFDRGMVTLTIGEKWSGAQNLSMTFHGRTPAGFAGSARLLIDLCEAALLSAWLSDDRRVGQHTQAFLNCLVLRCAEGKSQEAAEFLEKNLHEAQSRAQVEHIWSAVDRGEAELSAVMTEHARAFIHTAWRAYAKDHGAPSDRLTEALSMALDTDPLWTAKYANATLLAEALVKDGARIVNTGPKALEELIQQRIEWETIPA